MCEVSPSLKEHPLVAFVFLLDLALHVVREAVTQGFLCRRIVDLVA